MRILLVSLHFVEYAIELARALSHSNTVHMVLSRSKVSQTVHHNLEDLLGGNITYSFLEKYNRKNPKIFLNFLASLKLMHRFQPDVIHLQECTDPSNMPFVMRGNLLPLFRFIPLVCTVHDVYSHPGDRVSLFKWYEIYFFRKYLYRKIIVHGEALKQQLSKGAKRIPEDIFSIPHGCLFSFQHMQGELSEQEEDASVLFFGRMQEYKGLRHIIEAEPIVSRAIPDFKVIVAGQGDDLAAYRAQLQGNPHFEVHDRFIANEEVASFFARSAAVLAPYIEASQSGIVSMAYAFGKPVVASNAGSLGEMVEEGSTGMLVPPGDSEKLAQAIISLLQDRAERKKMGQEARRLAESALSWENIARQTEEVYNRALDRNSPKG